MLHVWLRAQHSPLAVWHAETKQWQTVESWQQLHDNYGDYQVRSDKTRKSNSHTTLCLYFPSSHLLQVDTPLNAGQLKQLGQIGKQYLFDEISLASIEQLEIRHITQPHLSYLYALAQSDMDLWQRASSLAGLTIKALLPDFLLLPTPIEGAGQQVVLYQDDSTLLLRQSEHQGLAVSHLPLVFERMAQLSEVCVLPIVETNRLATHAPLAAQTAALIADQQLLLTLMSTPPTPMPTPQRHALNFFTSSSKAQLSSYLRQTMLVALSALALQMVTDRVQTYRYHQATDATQTAIQTQYQSWFPDDRLNSITDIQTQMRPKLRSDSQDRSPHMAILAHISPLIKQSALQAQALTMQPSALSFTLIAPNRDSLDGFVNTLNEQGLTAHLEQVNSDEQGQFSGQMTVAVAPENTESLEANS